MNEDILKKYEVYLALKHRKEWTRITYLNKAKGFIDRLGKPIEELTKNDVNKWLANQNKSNYKPNGIIGRITGVNKFLDFLNDGKRSPFRIPTPKWKPVNRNVIDLDQISQMMRAAERLGPLHELVIRFIIDLDARPIEIKNAKYSNILGSKIFFDDSKIGDCYGFVTQGFMNALEKYNKVRPKPNKGYEDYVLITGNARSRGTPYSRYGNVIKRITRDISYEAKVGRNIRPYDLRASVMTAEFNSYINPKVIQRKARHRIPETTMRYNHVDDQMVQEYINNGLIFDKETLSDSGKTSLQEKNQKATKVKTVNPDHVLTQDLNKTLGEDNNSYSFSFSFSFDSIDTGQTRVIFKKSSSIHLFVFARIPEISIEVVGTVKAARYVPELFNSPFSSVFFLPAYSFLSTTPTAAVMPTTYESSDDNLGSGVLVHV